MYTMQITTEVNPDWVRMICEWTDLFSRDCCGYYLRGIAQEKGLGWLVWEDSEECEFGLEPNCAEAIAAWKEGRPLPEGYYRFDTDFACRSWAEGVKLYGVHWYDTADSDSYDRVVQQTLFGEQVYV